MTTTPHPEREPVITVRRDGRKTPFFRCDGCATKRLPLVDYHTPNGKVWLSLCPRCLTSGLRALDGQPPLPRLERYGAQP